jgi:hypothetical protein
LRKYAVISRMKKKKGRTFNFQMVEYGRGGKKECQNLSKGRQERKKE